MPLRSSSAEPHGGLFGFRISLEKEVGTCQARRANAGSSQGLKGRAGSWRGSSAVALQPLRCPIREAPNVFDSQRGL